MLSELGIFINGEELIICIMLMTMHPVNLQMMYICILLMTGVVPLCLPCINSFNLFEFVNSMHPQP